MPEFDGYKSDAQRHVAEHLKYEIEDAVRRAASYGLVLTIEQVNQKPPRMGNYKSVASVRPVLVRE